MPCNLCGKWNCVCQYSQPKQQQEFTSCFFSREAMKEHSDFHPQPKQEQDKPVAVVTGVYGGRFIVEPTNSAMVLPVNIALYTHPQQRTWVGLTDEEVNQLYTQIQEQVDKHWTAGGTSMMFPTTLYQAFEAKLKEKNNG